MNVGNYQAGFGRLQEALEDLQRAWADTADVWKDANSRSFEQEQLQAIPEELSTALPAISHLAQVMQAARRELEEA